MNSLFFGDFNPLSYAIGWTIIHSLWQATIIAAILRLLLIIIPNLKSQIKYGISLISMISILIAAILTFQKSWYAYFDQIDSQYISSQTLSAVDLEHSLSTTTGNSIWHYLQLWRLQIEAVIPILALIWSIGMLLLALRMIYGYYHLNRLKKIGIISIPEEWNARFESLKQKIGIRHEVILLQSNLIGEPITFGFLKPVILTPVSLFSGLSISQIEIILLHELAHIRRYDYFINLIQSLIEVLFFYHPAIWWISGKIREEREYCCDDLVLAIHNNPVLYAEALIQIQSQHFSFKTNLAMSASNKNNAFSNRIYRLFGKQDQKPSLFKGLFIMAFIFSSFLMQSYYFPAFAQEAVPQKKKLEKELRNNEKKEKLVLELGDLKLSKTHIDTEASEPLYLIDGVPASKEAVEEIDPKEINSVNVLKGKAALTKYGEKASNGVVEIYIKTTTKEPKIKEPKGAPQNEPKKEPVEKIKGESKKSSGKISIREMLPNSDAAEPLFVIDGVMIDESARKEMNNIDPKDIKSINVLKGEAALTKYGEKANNGVVEIYIKMEGEVSKKKKKELKRYKEKAKKGTKKKLPVIKEMSENDYELSIFPNPSGKENGPAFNFKLEEKSSARLEVYNSNGQLINTLINQILDKGNQQVTWKSDVLNSGTYYATLWVGGKATTKQFVVK